MADSIAKKKTKTNVIFGTALGVFSFLLNVVSGILVTRAIISYFGKSQYGIYTLAESIVSLFLLDLGIGTIIMKYYCQYEAKNETQKAADFLGLVMKIFIIADLVILVAFFVFYFLIDSIYIGLTSGEKDSLRICFTIAAMFAVVSFPSKPFDGVLAAKEDFIFQKLVEIIQKLLSVVAYILVICLKLNLYWLVALIGLSSLFSVILKIWYVLRKDHIRINYRFKPDRAFLKEILTFSLWVVISSLCWTIYTYLSPSILGIVCTTEEIAVFSIAASIYSYLVAFASITNNYFFPTISRLVNSEKTGEKSGIMKLSIFVGKIQYSAVLLLLVGFASCGYEFIMVWMKYDASFSIAYVGMLLLSFALLISMPGTVFKSEMYARGFAKHLAFAQIVSVVFFVVLTFLLGYFFGLLGAFIGIGLAKLLRVLLELFFYHKDLGTNIGSLYKKVCLRETVAVLPSLAIGLLLHFLLSFSFLVKFFIIGFSVLLSFVLLSFLFGFSKQEKTVIKNVIVRKR